MHAVTVLWPIQKVLRWLAAYTGWQGMAPQAKIAFQDLGSGAAGSIGPPDDLANDYYQYSYNQ